MANTTFNGPVISENGFESTHMVLTVTTTAALPAASDAGAGAMYIVSDNGAGNNEYAVVISTGAAWVLATGAALT